ncbi:hypothetical protein [Nocardia amamiensis]|uniref:hypothetical protein n=1 Tax=Nocardia amamiensis TaxID=404578 RepID=UPI00082E76D4|nr:hypothetical protein [Nocardia amamiensis]
MNIVQQPFAAGGQPLQGPVCELLHGQCGATPKSVRRIAILKASPFLTGWETAGAARSHRDLESPRAAKTRTTTEPTEPEAVAAESNDPAEPATAEVTVPIPVGTFLHLQPPSLL